MQSICRFLKFISCHRHDFFLSKTNGSDFRQEPQNTKHNHTKHSQSNETNVFNLNQNNKQNVLLAHSNDNPHPNL